MIIWIEGVDGTGKTTLCKTLHETYGYNAAKGIERQCNKKTECTDWRKLICTLHETRGTYIIDRSPITELVYRLVDTDPSYISSDLLKEMCINSKCIFCESDTAFRDAQIRGEDNIIEYKLHSKLSQLYPVVVELLHTHGRLPVMKYNYTCNDIKDVIKFINSSEVK